MRNEMEDSQYSRPFLDSEVELNEYQSVDDERNLELFTSFDAVNRIIILSRNFLVLKVMNYGRF
jgi:hypothetical protein